MKIRRRYVGGCAAMAAVLVAAAYAQQGGFEQGGFGQGGPGQGRRGGMGGPGGGVQEDRPVVKQFDANNDGWLNTEERAKAREYVKANPARGGGPGGMGGGGRRGPGGPGGGFPGGPEGMGGPGGRRNREPAKPGAQVKPADVSNVPANRGLYDVSTLRTVFVDFEEKDWQAELSEFHGTDVDVAATVTVDGNTYRNVGLRYRGNSSLNMVPDGFKKSFNVDFGLADKKQRLLGYKTLNLLNSNGDPTMMRAALYSRIAGETIAIPKVNFVKVVVNGENWGVFANVQQVDKTFLQENFKEDAGVRWKTPGSPQGRASLAYLGEDAAAYKRIYDIKTKDEKEASEGWKGLIDLTKVLNETPAAELPARIEPILDVPGALRFLALENALVNSDGYWVRSSDYNLYRDTKGRFHVFPHDFNETFLPEGGPGMGGRGGPRGGGFPDGPGGFGGPPPDGDGAGFGGPPQGGFGRPGGFPGGPRTGGSDLGPTPLVDAQDASKPLISKLLAVPKYKAMYLRDVAEIATKWLDWNRVRPLVAGYDAVISAEVKADTKQLASYDAYRAGTGLTTAPATSEGPGGFGGPGGRAPNLKVFIEGRRKMLLADAAVQSVLNPSTGAVADTNAKRGKP